MDRRKFVAGLGALAGGGAIATGTGAFSSVEAERDIAVSVADDSSALLGIQPTDEPNGEYADLSDGDTLAINLTDSNDNVTGGGEGINTNATTSIADLFEVQNQGSQTVDLAVSPLVFTDTEGGGLLPDKAILVLLVPQNPDAIDSELEFDPTNPPFFVSFVQVLAIKEIDPGQELTFGLEAVALPESAIGNVEIDDEIQIAAQEV